MAKLTVMPAPLPCRQLVVTDMRAMPGRRQHSVLRRRLGMMASAKDVTMATVERHGSVYISRSYRTGWDF